MGHYETGIFDEKVPYLKFGQGERTLVIFPGTSSLYISLSAEAPMQAKLYQKVLPPGVTYYILDYPKELPSTATYESIASNFADIIRKYIGKAYIAGISFGGFIATTFAAQYPELTEHLFLIISGYKMSDSGMRMFVERGLESAHANDGYKLIRVFDNLYGVWWARWLVKIMNWKNLKIKLAKMNPLSTFITAYSHIKQRKDDLKAYLPMIKSPTVVIGGTRDCCFSEAIFRETVDLIPNAQLELLEGCSHMVPIERMKDFKSLLLKYV